MSDWGGVWDGANTFNGGNDLDFPGLGLFGALGSFFADDLPGAVANGTVTEARLTDAVIRILTLYFHLGQDEKSVNHGLKLK